MKVLDPGHVYALDNLNEEGDTALRFFKDEELHPGEGQPGTSCQEVLRAVIHRVDYLDGENHWVGNDAIIQHARQMLVLFEQRALERKVEKGLAIEKLPTGSDGHLTWSLV